MKTRHAYMIMAHGDLYMLQTLVHLIDDPRNDIFIHVDRKWKAFDCRKLKTKYSKLEYTAQRRDVRWGDASMVHAELLLMRTAIAEGGYSYYHLLSGADLPIKSQDEIHRFFHEYAGQEFVFYWETESAKADARYKVERYHFFMRYERGLPRVPSILLAKLRLSVADLLYKVLGPRNAYGVCKGPNWVSLTDELLRALVRDRAQLCRRYRWTRNPDEIFVQTYIRTHHPRQLYRGGDASADYRYTCWQEGDPSPRTLTMADLSVLLQSPCLFARKFSSEVDREVIDAIATHVRAIEIT